MDRHHELARVRGFRIGSCFALDTRLTFEGFIADLVLLDLMMPEVDGFAVLESLRAEPATRDLEVMVLSAKDLSAEERTRLQGYGIRHLVQKGHLDRGLLRHRLRLRIPFDDRDMMPALAQFDGQPHAHRATAIDDDIIAHGADATWPGSR